MSRADDIFERLEDGGESAIDELVATRQSEELFLDFKQSADGGTATRLHQNDRKNLAKAISGFANSEGGVIVWGVDCRPGEGGGDLPTRKVPLADCRAFVSWIESAVSGCTLPPCIGVRTMAVETASPLGYAVTLVPKSPRAPHQDVLTGRYFIRAGSDFLPAPHGVLAGLFGRRPEPHVFHQFYAEPVRVSSENGIAVKFGINLVSDGPGLAEDVFMTLDIFPPGGKSQFSLSLEAESKFDHFQQLGGIHTTVISKPFVKFPPGSRITPLVLDVLIEPPFRSRLKMILNFGCANAPTHQRVWDYEPKELEQICHRVAVAQPESRGRLFGVMFLKTDNI